MPRPQPGTYGQGYNVVYSRREVKQLRKNTVGVPPSATQPQAGEALVHPSLLSASTPKATTGARRSCVVGGARALAASAPMNYRR
jgi:hypothetical protein